MRVATTPHRRLIGPEGALKALGNGPRVAQEPFSARADEAQREALAWLGLAQLRGLWERLYRALVLRALRAIEDVPDAR